MAHGINAMLKRGTNTLGGKSDGKTGIGSRRIFAPQFKLQVLDSYRNDADCKGNQRATARKYGIHRRQIQKWLQVENNLRNSVIKSKCGELIVSPEARKCGLVMALRSAEHRQRDDVCVEAYSRQGRCGETPGEASERSCARAEEMRDAVDKRVPDIPQQHSPVAAIYATTTTTLPVHHHEWQPVHPLRHGSPDDTSSSRSSHSERDIVELFGSPSHCSPSPHSPPCVPMSLTTYPPVPVSRAVPIATSSFHIPPPGTLLSGTPCPTSYCSGSGSELSLVPLPLPLDFTTHSRRVVPSPDSPRGAIATSPAPRSPATAVTPFGQQNDSAAPMDLSLKKPYPRASPDLHAPVPVEATPPAPRITLLGAPLCSPPPVCTTVLEHDPQIWDLSTKGVKRQHYDHDNDDIIDVLSNNTSATSAASAISESVTSSATGNNRPIKLFKPYLDHVIDECPDNNTNTVTATDIKPVIVSTIDSSIINISYPESDHYYANNNNNNIADIKIEYPSYYKDENYHHGNIYSPVNGDYYPNGGLHFMETRLHYDESRFFNKHSNAMKQRQSYSLDFKLSAIECYYSDAVCRGNQRAVASKFKIHRRQVQKWLKQEDQLRQRNETKPMHIVR